MNKNVLIALIVIFISSTALVYMSGDSGQMKQVAITTQATQVAQNNNAISGSLEGVKFQNTDTQFKNTGAEFKNTGAEFQNTNTKLQNTKIDNQQTGYGNTGFENTKIKYEEPKPEPVPEPVQYTYRSLNWNDWRSEFLNRILDDSDEIQSLNYYEAGTVIWFSFDVTDKGEIKNITIIAPQLRKNDKTLFRMLLKSYEHKEITKFPPNSKRKSVKVKSIMLLDNEERRAKPENFFDSEKVRVQ